MQLPALFLFHPQDVFLPLALDYIYLRLKDLFKELPMLRGVVIPLSFQFLKVVVELLGVFAAFVIHKETEQR